MKAKSIQSVVSSILCKLKIKGLSLLKIISFIDRFAEAFKAEERCLMNTLNLFLFFY